MRRYLILVLLVLSSPALAQTAATLPSAVAAPVDCKKAVAQEFGELTDLGAQIKKTIAQVGQGSVKGVPRMNQREPQFDAMIAQVETDYAACYGTKIDLHTIADALAAPEESSIPDPAERSRYHQFNAKFQAFSRHP